ncbi:hypothetical protein [[Mycobacterium] burgundiense]|uniref:Uncharacterized protein n=1 Tax=[Mycobacterium] burgundiense TaxID=3064286 RepID=A0ABM9L9V2_9MYCO|nr:hypothetical protein [Mycolicibacterium sp. MU0053]CAJ1495391.1 hypothetical protein MU0053_000369 [Mycolicibacterium sp. MU0053]
MATAWVFLLLAFVLLAPFGLVAALAAGSHRSGKLRLRLDQFRLSAPLVGPLDDDGIRERFRRRPAWPESGARGERR